ncbi:hypothetical protein Drorol1_Dr00019517 [Drosera rotundifolia]
MVSRCAVVMDTGWASPGFRSCTNRRKRSSCQRGEAAGFGCCLCFAVWGVDEDAEEKDVVGRALQRCGKVLAFCTIVFSRVIPVGGTYPHLHPLWQTAEQFGSSSNTLARLGALDRSRILYDHQSWRLITNIWFHAGLIHLLVNILSLVFIGISLEQQFSFVRIGAPACLLFGC